MLVLQKWFLSLFKVFTTSVCIERCYSGFFLAGKYLSDRLLFAVDHHSQLLQLLCYLVLNTEVLILQWYVPDWEIWGMSGAVYRQWSLNTRASLPSPALTLLLCSFWTIQRKQCVKTDCLTKNCFPTAWWMRSRPLITSWSTGTSWSTVSRGLASQTGTSQRSESTFK